MPLGTRDDTDSAASGCKTLIVYCYPKCQCLCQAYQADPEEFYPVSAPGFLHMAWEGRSVSQTVYLSRSPQ